MHVSVSGKPDNGSFWQLAEIIIMGIVLAPIVCLSYVFLMAISTGEVPAETYNVEASAEQIDRHTVSVSYLGGEDQWKVIHIWVTIDGKFFPSGASEGSFSSTDPFSGDGITPISPGRTILITDTSGTHITDRPDHVKVFAEFRDGTMVLLVDSEL